MPKRPYSKSATTFEQQVALLRSRGMEIPNEERAEALLRHMNYYRLTAYWLPFETNHAIHQFKSGTTFEQVVNLYEFDRELRLLVLDAMEKLEVSVRRQWSYHLGHLHGPHAHLDASLHMSTKHWQSNLAKLQSEVSRSQEVFVRHFSQNYLEDLPPVWASSEVMSLGLLSRWFSDLKPMKARRAIASAYQLDEKVFQSWLHHFSLIRNVCAHHGRLWNREFPVQPMLPNRPLVLFGRFAQNSKSLYNGLLMLVYMLDCINPDNQWRQRLFSLLSKHQVPFDDLGAPPNWAANPLWKAAS
ncbi:Abi family protein [Myxococcota bacterium]|nr:Abi family protein [Myxococcota bacterium]